MDQADALPSLFTETGRELMYERGNTIIRAGDTPSGVYLITDGWIQVYNLCHDGEPNIIMSLRSGDIFPLEWIVSGVLHEVSFAAVTTTTVLRVSKEHFTQNLKANPRMMQAVLRKMSYYFCQLSSELEHLPYHSARERVAFRLVSIAQYLGQVESDNVNLTLPIPNEFIARSSNMTRETASREISWLIRKGFIERQNGYIVIKNLPELKREASRGFRLRHS
jgi:CRP/FNR family cyclic AMP-dependent transcriptional regulator